MTRTKATTRPPHDAPITEPAAQAEISVYQQLRHHLAVLKLHAAAEALPGVLERARGEGWSMTGMLEQLLAVEVEENQARRLAGRLRFASLPTPATLDGFDYDAAPGVDRQLIAELGTCGYLESATNVLLMGPPGPARRIWRSAWPGLRCTPGTARTSPPRRI